MLADSLPATHLHELPCGNNRLLSYIVLGLPLGAQEPPGQCIIYHHGWPSCRYEALALHEAALSRKWRVIAVDRYGVGKSSFNPQGSFESWAKDIEHLLDTLGIQRAVMLGMSGGGPYACACARYLPARTAALVTVAAMLATNDPQHRDLLQQMHWMDRLHSYAIDNPLSHKAVLLLSLPVLALSPHPIRIVGKLPAAIGKLVSQAVTAVGWAEADRRLLLEQPEVTWQLLPQLMQQSVVQGPAGLGWDMKLTSSAWSFQLEKIRVPVALVCHGTDDVSLPASMAQRLAEQIPGAQLKLYPEEGHLSLLFKQAGDILATLAAALAQ